MKKYRKRIADDILARKLEGKGAVLIENGVEKLPLQNKLLQASYIWMNQRRKNKTLSCLS